MSYLGYRKAILASVASLAIWANPSLAQTVGTTGAVNPASTGTPPGGSTRTIELGTDVVFRERIQTTGTGALQVLFVDRSTIKVGPNSDITIDEFVYNPNAGTGTFVASLAKGSLRFLGGQISRNSGATFKTPVATVGVRGTDLEMAFIPTGTTPTGEPTGNLQVENNAPNSSVNVTVENPDGTQSTASVGHNESFSASFSGDGPPTTSMGQSNGVGGGATVAQGQGGGNAGPAPAPAATPVTTTTTTEQPETQQFDEYSQEAPPPSPPEPDPDPEPDPP